MGPAARAWALPLLVLALSGCCCSAFECPAAGRFWDGCNWCFCRGNVVLGCTNMACVGLDAFRLDAGKATIGPPQRPGIIGYRPGRGRVVDPEGWPCQMGSTWLEQGGCVRCICSNKAIKCRDSGLCLNGELVSNEVVPQQAEYARRRRDAADSAAPPPDAGAATNTTTTTTAAAAPTTPPVAATAPAAAATATTAAAAEPAVKTSPAAAAATAAATAAPAAAPASAPAAATAGASAANTPPANTVVKDRSCRSGSTWEEECNACWCLDNVRAACTTNSCEQSLAIPLGAPVVPTTSPKPTSTSTTTHAAAPTTVATTPAPEETTTATPPTTTAAVNITTTSSRRKRRVVLLTA